jgi:excisionase family DNA binding protein
MIDEFAARLIGRITVVEAAGRLGVTQQEVRRLIRAGELPAERVGGRTWLISSDSVERRAEHDPRVGRRLSSPNAWAALFLIMSDPVPWLNQTNRWRIGHWLSHHHPSDNRSRFTGRGRPTGFRAHTSLLSSVRDDSALMLTGVPGAMERRLGIVGGGGEVDAYVSSADLDAVIARHHMRPSRNPNVVLWVVDPFTTPWPPAKVAPASAIALDLLDSPEPRAKQVGAQVLRGIERAYDQDHARQ